MSFFRLSHRPFSRWPISVHLSLALLAVLLAWAVGYGMRERIGHQFAASSASLAALQQQARLNQPAMVHAPTIPIVDFTQSLPSRAQVDDVVRDMGRNSQALGVSLGALTVVHQAPSAGEWGKVQLTVSAVGEYSKCKGWLAELLARYPSLAVQSLTIRSGINNATRQDWQLALTLYAKD
jgi:hypothetical protein